MGLCVVVLVCALQFLLLLQSSNFYLSFNLFSINSNSFTFSFFFNFFLFCRFGILHDFPSFILFHDLCKHKKSIFLFHNWQSCTGQSIWICMNNDRTRDISLISIFVHGTNTSCTHVKRRMHTLSYDRIHFSYFVFVGSISKTTQQPLFDTHLM